MNPGMLLAAAAGSLVASLLVLRCPRGWLAALVASALASLGAAAQVLVTGIPWQWRGALRVGGEAVHLHLDGVSAFFLCLVAVVGAAGAVYAHEYWTAAAHPRSVTRGRVGWSGLLGCLGVLLLTANGLHFLLAWEGFAVCGYFLITLDARRRQVRAAGWLYLAASHTGTLALFAFFACLAARTGSWELGPLQDRPELAPLFWWMLVGFGLKAGLFPLHIWLPSAHANAPSHVSALLSGVALKMGIYGLVRFSGWLPLPEGAGWVVALLGGVSAVLGVAFALAQHDLKRLLAYHSVENIGIILLGVGFALIAAGQGHPDWGALALAGGLLHVWNHGLFKALLFLGAGSVLHATGTREMSQLGGIWRAMPWTASLFTLGALAISGLPPLNGFVSEWLVYLGLFDAAQDPGAPSVAATPAIIFLAMTGALAAACFVKVCGVVFLGAPRSAHAHRAHECGPWMRAPMVVLALACLAIGLAPVVFWPAVRSAVGAWSGRWSDLAAPVSLVPLTVAHGLLALLATALALLLWRRIYQGPRATGPTWDCGYARPTARMQYTAGSFAGILTEWFAGILRPERHERPVETIFPRHALREEHTPETVLERVVEPLARQVLRLSGLVRRLQHGGVQAYLLYLVVGLLAAAAWVTLGAP